MATSNFNTPTKRARLEPRREPYWHKISKGRHIGYRKGTGNGGSWVARSGRKTATIGDDSTLDYDAALKAVIKWCDAEQSGTNGKYLLRDCVKAYVGKLEKHNSAKVAKDIRLRLAKHLPDDLLDTDIKKLTTTTLQDWLESMAVISDDKEKERKSKDSANRVLTMLRAALNRAYKHGLIESNRAWKNVEPFEDVAKARDLFLKDEQIKRLLGAIEEPAFRDLCQAAIYTAARLGELVSARAKDFDGSVLRLSGKTGPRDVHLSTEGRQYFKELVKDNLPEAALLPAPGGRNWRESEPSHTMRSVVRRARLPRDCVFYSLRHYTISKQVKAGISLLAIAKNAGTSVLMIEKHYGKFQPGEISKLLDLVELG